MAKCKLCKTDIPDGAEYCQDCQMKSDKANESYLDSLLNSVKNTSEPSDSNIRVKNKSKNENNNNPADKVRKASDNIKNSRLSKTREKVNEINYGTDDDDLYRVDFSDVEDFDMLNFKADLQDMDSDIEISAEDLFGANVAKLLNDAETSSYDNKNVPDAQIDIQPEFHERSVTDTQDISDKEVMGLISEAAESEKKVTEGKTEAATTTAEEETAAQSLEEPAFVNNQEIEDNAILKELEQVSEDSGLDLDLDELLNSLNIQEAVQSEEEPAGLYTESAVLQKEERTESSEEDMFHIFRGEDAVDNFESAAGAVGFEPVEDEDEDFLNLLNQISGNDPISEDLKAISDMMYNPQREIKPVNMPGDVGEVFSDALTAVSSLKDFESREQDLLNPDTDQNRATIKGTKEIKGKKKSDKKPEKQGEDKQDKPKKSLLQRLFGNVKNDKTATRFADERKREEEESGVPGDKSKKDKGTKKGKKAVEAPIAEETIGSAKRPVRDMEEEEAPLDKKAKKKKAKAEKKKAKEAIEVIDEINEDPGRINRLGATIVFILFGALASVLILGTNIISYTLNIQHAADYFSKQKYTEAYYEVYGVELRDEDLELYEKIATVMFVNKQLNSYNNYINIKQYPQALDSLLKGLKRYDKYIELATYLGVDSDLNYVRDQILAELNKKYKLTEDEAVKINSLTNMKDYSLAVYDIVLERMNK